MAHGRKTGGRNFPTKRAYEDVGVQRAPQSKPPVRKAPLKESRDVLNAKVAGVASVTGAAVVMEFSKGKDTFSRGSGAGLALADKKGVADFGL